MRAGPCFNARHARRRAFGGITLAAVDDLRVLDNTILDSGVDHIKRNGERVKTGSKFTISALEIRARLRPGPPRPRGRPLQRDPAAIAAATRPAGRLRDPRRPSGSTWLQLTVTADTSVDAGSRVWAASDDGAQVGFEIGDGLAAALASPVVSYDAKLA